MRLNSKILSRRDGYRKVKDRLMRFLLALLCFVAVAPLVSIFLYVFQKGVPALNLDFFTQLPAPVGETGGGLANAFVGSLVLIVLASLVGIPWGLAAGIFLSEYAQGKTAKFLRFTIDLMTSIPSIIIGIFAYALFVVPMKSFSAVAGGFALAMIMIPIVARSTEEILKLIPSNYREAGLALGLPRWKVILSIIVKGSTPGLLTGIMLSVARVAGETAPLLFTALHNQFWATGLGQPIASIPVQIYTYAVSPFEDWHQKAWAAAFVLVMFVLTINLVTRSFFARRT